MKSILKKFAGFASTVIFALGIFGCSNVSNSVVPPAPVKATVATPAFSVASGEVENGTSVTISCATEGSKIYYTTDGTDPTASSTEFAAAISVTPPLTIKAIAVKDGMNNSAVASASYTKKAVATPAFSVDSGEVESGTSVTITCETEGAKIYYTTDGSEPTASSTEYTAAISITEDVTIKTIAVKDGLNDSAIASVSYTIEQIPEGFVKVKGTDVGAFYIAKTEITYTKWFEVYHWATNNGYVFQNVGREYGGMHGGAPAANSKQPVIRISWRDAVVWCNAASEKDGLTPVYEYEGSVLKLAENYKGKGTNRKNTTDVISKNGKAENATVKVGANGYRLPTEAEWEYAAKGGANYAYSGHSWQERVAWYSGNSDNHPHDVGTKLENGYGLYDMSGNVDEWCWNTWSETSNTRVRRGGNCSDDEEKCTVTYRSNGYSSRAYDNTGFRVCRSAK